MNVGSIDVVVEEDLGERIAHVPHFNDVGDARKGEGGSAPMKSVSSHVPERLCRVRLRSDEVEIEAAQEVDAGRSAMSIKYAEVVHVTDLSLNEEILFVSVLQ